MKTVTSFSLNLGAAALIVIASATVALAQAGSDTCVGVNATIGGTCAPLINNTSGTRVNTAVGFEALEFNTTGASNVAIGDAALTANTTGSDNTATGVGVLTANAGNLNTATGFEALFSNTTGGNNTASGAQALFSNTAGGDNTAAGIYALFLNTTGGNNTASGENALFSNTSGTSNSALGLNALKGNTTGDFNVASGAGALFSSNTGGGNTASGFNALEANTTGSSNIGIGFGAGGNLTTGDNNIDIGNVGVAAESNAIRIGTQGTQTDTFIAGIFGTPKISKACEVVVESTGRLGCVKSSARYKRDIRDMGDASDKLMKLRPVTFTYKADSTGIQQYGLIAEEVEKVYPELVIDDADGKAETVAYQVLPAMLLNEVQKQSRQLAQKDAQIAALQKQLDTLRKKDDQIDALSERVNALEQQARKATPDHLASAIR